MTTKLDPRLMPAQTLTDSSPTTGTDGEEVKDMAIFESRRARSERARDELAQLGTETINGIDRAVILESMRQRRRLLEQQYKIHNELFGLRANR